jgi:hypothetical protein
MLCQQFRSSGLRAVETSARRRRPGRLVGTRTSNFMTFKAISIHACNAHNLRNYVDNSAPLDCGDLCTQEASWMPYGNLALKFHDILCNIYRVQNIFSA